jgi:DNA-binding NtrC family response regulator
MSSTHHTFRWAPDVTSHPLPAVLVVDDERIVAETLAAILKNHDFNATPVCRAEDALAVARESPLDAVVCDIILGNVNGIELATQIRAIHPGCRVILISGANESAELLEHAGEPFVVLAKPFHPETLLEKLRQSPQPIAT